MARYSEIVKEKDFEIKKLKEKIEDLKQALEFRIHQVDERDKIINELKGVK